MVLDEKYSSDQQNGVIMSEEHVDNSSLCDTCLCKMGKRAVKTVSPEVCERGTEVECPDYYPHINEFIRRMNLVFSGLRLDWDFDSMYFEEPQEGEE